jgi:hypothetical protein
MLSTNWFGTALVVLTCASAWADLPPDLGSPLLPPEEHYRLDVRYIPEAGRIVGNGTIRLKNSTQQTLSRIRLAWDGKQPGDLEVTLGDKPAPFRGFTRAAGIRTARAWLLDLHTSKAI